MAFHDVKVFLKQFLSQRTNLPQATGVYENFTNAGTIFFQGVEQLVCRGAVEITH